MKRLLIVFALSLLFGTSVSAEQQQIVMGTGGVTGVYYPAGGAICQMVNNRFRDHGLRCFVESSEGSVQNLKRLRSGDIDLAIVQSDWKVHAWKGSGAFESYGENKKLRSVMNLYSEPFTVVARKDSGIQSVQDLKGKRVNIGNPGSGQRATMEWLMTVLGWWKSDFAEVHELKSDDQAAALCEDVFDAFVFVAGSPNSSVKLATTDCASVIVPVQSDKLDKAIDESNFYIRTSVPGGIYRGNAKDVPTFGVSAKLVSSSEVDSGLIKALVEAVFEELNQFKRLHPALNHLERSHMFSDNSEVPLHHGAETYFLESGIVVSK